MNHEDLTEALRDIVGDHDGAPFVEAVGMGVKLDGRFSLSQLRAIVDAITRHRDRRRIATQAADPATFDSTRDAWVDTSPKGRL